MLNQTAKRKDTLIKPASFTAEKCVCPLYSTPRRALPFTGAQVLVEGHVMQADGCTARNLTSLVRHIMAFPGIDVIVDFFRQAIKKRREARRHSLLFQ